MLKIIREIDWKPTVPYLAIILIAVGSLLVPRTEAPQNQQTATESDQENSEEFPSWVSVEAAATALIALFAFWQIRESRRSSECQLRAYVSIEDISLDAPNISNSDYDTPIPNPAGFIPHDAVRLIIKNNGQTPAHDVAGFLNWDTISPFNEIPLGTSLINYVTAADISSSSRQFLDSGRQFSHTIWIKTSLAPFRRAMADEARLIFYGWIEYTDIFGVKWSRNFRYVWQPNRSGDDRLYPGREGNSEQRVSV